MAARKYRRWKKEELNRTNKKVLLNVTEIVEVTSNNSEYINHQNVAWSVQ